MKNIELKGFFIKSLTLLFVLVISDQIIGFFIHKLYFNQVAGTYFRATYAIDKVTADCLVFGSSRANHHYVPSVFNKELKKSFYNAGRDGNGILYTYAVIKAVSARYSPGLILVDLYPGELYYQKEDYEKLSSLLPYYNQHPEIREVVNLRGALEKYKLYSATYPFNSQLVSLSIGRFNLTRDPGLQTQGYIPLYSKMQNIKADNHLNNPHAIIDVNKINALKSISNICNDKNIQLVFICSPIFSNAENISANIEIKNITEKYKIEYWDYSSDTAYDNHPEYFKDNGHLNDEGARIFSYDISKKIIHLKKFNKGSDSK